MDWKSAQQKDKGLILIPERWLHLHYYEALNILFRMENSLRVFVYVVLKNEHKDKWMDVCFKTGEDDQSTIKSIAAKRLSQAQGHGYLGYEISSPLMYLNSGELTSLIDTYWKLFKPYFKGDQNIIKTKFKEIETVRNSLAHFRPIKEDDIELIKQNIKHTFVDIERECLDEVSNTLNVVPTNTNDEWYKNITELRNELCEIKCYQSKREKWIRIEIVYNCPVIKNERYWENYYSYKILNFISPAIVRLPEFSELTKLCTYVTELVPYVGMETNFIPKFSKQISLIFNRSVLEKEYKTIKTQLESLLSLVKQESDLIQKDNLARGSIIDSASASAFLNKGEKEGEKSWWSITSSLECSFGENDPPEYWGSTGLYQRDFVASSKRYPWMPSDISEDELPF